MLALREGIEIARTGTWKTSTGEWNCTRDQLADAVRAQKSGKFRSPILIARGHTDSRFASDRQVDADGEPALGQVKNLRTAEDGDSLIGDLLIPDWLDQELPAVYPSRSIEADLGVETPDGQRFGMVMSGLALLGVTRPAIQPLAELAASEEVPAEDAAHYVSAMSIAASMPEDAQAIEASSWNEALHPRGGTGSATGGQFVSRGSGYASKDKGKNKTDQAQTVKDVQKELVRLGLLDASSGKHGGIDGLFGPKTEAAVRAWQTAHGHLATGRVSMALLKTLKAAKTSSPKPHKMAHHSVTPSKTAPERTTAARLRHGKVKAAAEELVAGLDLAVQQVGDGFVACGDPFGRTWVAKWTAAENGDETIEIGELTPATVAYTPLAATVSAGAAHNMTRPAVLWPRDWEVNTPTSHGVSVDITQLREALGLDDTADEAAALATIAELKSKPVASEPPTDSGTAPDSPAQPLPSDKSELPSGSPAAPDLDALVAEKVAAALGPIAEANRTLVAEVGTLSGELAARKAEEAGNHKTRILASALELGKIKPADREKWSERYDKAPEVTEDILNALAAGTEVPIRASGYAGGEDSFTSQDDEILRAIGFGSLVGGGE